MNKKPIETLCRIFTCIFVIFFLSFFCLFIHFTVRNYPFEKWDQGQKLIFIILFLMGVICFIAACIFGCSYHYYLRHNVSPQLIELYEIVHNSSDYNLDQLKTEVLKLKSEELEAKLEINQTKLTRLITNLQNKVNNDTKAILDLYLQAHAQMIAQYKEDDTFAQGQLTNFENALQNHLTQEELQTLRTQQRETLVLERQLNKLQGGRTRGTQ